MLTIVIPCYNEAESLREYLQEVVSFCREKGFKLIIVDDGSKDETNSVIKEHDDGDVVKILKHKVNSGYGAAIKSGISEAKTPYVITMDADGQHKLEDVQMMYEEIRHTEADMIVGSRKGQLEAGYYRKFGKMLIRNLAKFMLPVNIYDINSGMKIYRTELVKKYIRLCPDTMAFSDIITLIFISRHHLVLERRITVRRRHTGKSTVSTITAIDTILEIINIVVLFNPMKVFFPISVFCILIGIAWGLPIVIHGRGVSVGTLLSFVTGFIFFFFGFIAEQLSLIRRSRLD